MGRHPPTRNPAGGGSGGQPGGFTVFGSNACVGTTGVPSLAGTGDPTLGGVFRVQLAGAAPLRFVLNLFGFTDTVWQGLPLPLDLSVIGAAPGCELSTSGEVMNVFISNFTGGATQSILIPGSLSLVGTTVYSAWVVIDQTAPGNPGGYVSTNSLATRIGL